MMVIFLDKFRTFYVVWNPKLEENTRNCVILQNKTQYNTQTGSENIINSIFLAIRVMHKVLAILLASKKRDVLAGWSVHLSQINQRHGYLFIYCALVCKARIIGLDCIQRGYSQMRIKVHLFPTKEKINHYFEKRLNLKFFPIIILAYCATTFISSVLTNEIINLLFSVDKFLAVNLDRNTIRILREKN